MTWTNLENVAENLSSLNNSNLWCLIISEVKAGKHCANSERFKIATIEIVAVSILDNIRCITSLSVHGPIQHQPNGLNIRFFLIPKIYCYFCL